jgi:hypothetical protein
MIKRIILGCFTWLLLCGQVSFAKDTPGPLFKTRVDNLTLSINTTIPHRCYNFAGIKATSPFVTLSNIGGERCTPNERGYCLFQVCDNSPASFTYSGPAGSTDFNLCLNGKGDTSSCQKVHFSTQYAYVADDFGHVWQCPVNPNGTFGTCLILTPAKTPPGYIPWGGPFKIAFTNVAGSEYSYIADGDFTGFVYTCSLNSSNDTYNRCVISESFIDASQVAFATVSDIKFAYVADYGDPSVAGEVWKCRISPADGSLNSCTQQLSGTFSQADGITIEKFQDTHYAYVSDFGNKMVYQCTIDSTNGSFISCLPATTPGMLAPWEVAFQRVNGVLYAYIADSGAGSPLIGKVWQCSVNSDGSFNNCNQLHPNFTTMAYREPFGIVFNKADGILYAYVSDDGTSRGTYQMFQCTLNDDGTFNECSVLPGPTGLSGFRDGGWRPNGVTFLTREKGASRR